MASEPLQFRPANISNKDGQQGGFDTQSSRLSLPFSSRLRLSFGVSFLTGFGLGAVHGGKMAGLRFRAENAHRLPDTTAGWYLYHKSKNYQATYGGVKEGIRMGLKIGSLVAAYVLAEEALDAYREEKDFLSSLIAGMGTAGAYGIWNSFSMPTLARLGKVGFQFGLCFGLAQDATNSLRGYRPRYIRAISNSF